MDLISQLLLVWSFILGAVIGSFLNVCIARVPEKKSIVSPPSSCPNCGTGIKFYDNIPIISYIFLGGKCRNCREKISFRYPLVEFCSAFFSVTLFIRYGPSLSFLIYLLFIATLITISFIDFDHRIIPDVISLPGIIVGFICSFFLPEISWSESIIGILIGGGSLMLVAITYEMITGREGMGGGDIKLLAMLGAFIGWQGVLFTIMASSLLGTFIGGGGMLLSGKGRDFTIPFGPFLSIGAAIYLFYGEFILQWYLGLYIPSI